MWFHLLALAKMENSNKKENAAQSSAAEVEKDVKSKSEKKKKAGSKKKMPFKGKVKIQEHTLQESKYCCLPQREDRGRRRWLDSGHRRSTQLKRIWEES